MGLHTSQVIETVCNKLSSIKCSKVDESGPLLGRDPLWFDSCNQLQSNLSNTDTEGTEQSVRIREVSVYKRGHYDNVTFMTLTAVLSVQ